MAIGFARRWATGLGFVAGAGIATAVAGAGVAQAETSDLAGVLTELFGVPDSVSIASTDDPLGAANTNLTDGVTALVRQLFDDPTNNDLAGHVSTQDGALSQIGTLQSSEGAILAHTGSLSSGVNELFFTPLNDQWADVSGTVLSADETYAEALASGNETAIATAQTGLIGPEFQLLGTQVPSLFIDFAAIPFRIASATDLSPADFAMPSIFDIGGGVVDPADAANVADLGDPGALLGLLSL